MSREPADYVPPLSQIAFSVVDLRLTERWFREGFGLLPAGGNRWLMRGPLAAHVQGLPKAASTCWWLVGRNPWFQLELFQFERPMAKLMPADFRPCDIGYTRIGIWVENFDATLQSLARLGTQPLTAPMGELGARRVCVRNPDGVYVEIMEDDPLPHANQRGRLGCPAAIRSVTASVPDLDDAAAYFGRGIGLAPSTVRLHTPEHEALWGLAGADTRSQVFDGGDVLVELAHYLDPAGRPRPRDYRVCDQGILNIAFGARTRHDFDTVYDRAWAFGATPNGRPVNMPGAAVVYANDKHGFSVETLYIKPGVLDRMFGFQPRPPHKRPDPDTHRVEHTVHIAAPVPEVWEAVTNSDNMSRWSGFNPVTVIRQGETGRYGAGSERLMHGPPGVGTVIEQVIAADPERSLRYRVTAGSPLTCHQGQVTVNQAGDATKLRWAIRFRPKLPGTGRALRRVMQTKLRATLNNHLKTYIENP